MEKNFWKITLPLLLALVVLATAVTVAALVKNKRSDPANASGTGSARQRGELSGSCGEDLTWDFDQSSGQLTISGTGNMTDFHNETGIEYSPWHQLTSSVKSISLPSGLTNISANAFLGCDQIERLEVPGTVLSIEYQALSCSGLKEIVFQNPSTWVLSYFASSGYDPGHEEPYLRHIGSEQTIIYGKHDPAMENGRPLDLNTSSQDFYHVFEHKYGVYSYVEAYARKAGYTFYATNMFSDVKEHSYYLIPVAWAYGKGITGGTGDGSTFSPDEVCTREQILTFLYAAYSRPKVSNTASCPFQDIKNTAYYYEPILWAAENRIVSGTGDGNFGLGQPCTRAQVAMFLWRAAGSPKPKAVNNPFTDVSADDWYYEAVLWAVENKITGGTGDASTFSPNDACTRGQIVTFLKAALG